jgi:hypothetical protein
MKLPIELVHKIQYDFAAAKYKSGSPVFNSIDEFTIKVVLESLYDWAHDEDGKVDLSKFLEG